MGRWVRLLFGSWEWIGLAGLGFLFSVQDGMIAGVRALFPKAGFVY